MKPKPKKELQTGPDNGLLYQLLVFVPVVFIPLVFSNATVDFVLLPKFISYAIYTFLLCLFAYYLSARQKQSFIVILKEPLFIIYILYLLISFAGLFSTINYADGIFEWLKMVLFPVSVFCAAVIFYKQENTISLFAKAVTVLNILIVIIGLYQFAMISMKASVTHNTTYIMSATFAHKNIYSEMLLLTLPFVLYNVFTEDKWWRSISITFSCLTLFLITVALTRAVWLATLGGLFVSALIYILIHRTELLKRSFYLQYKRSLIIVLAFFLSVLIAIVIYSRIDSFSTISKQTISLSGYSHGSGAERIQLWKKSIKVFKEAPVFGSGIGSWKIKVLNYGHSGLETEDDKTFHQRPHNDFIWILCEQGIVGLLLYLTIISMAFFYTVRLMQSAENKSTGLFYFLCMFAFTGYLIFSFFSFPKERIEHNVILLFVFAIILSGYTKKYRRIKESNLYQARHIVFPLLIAVSAFAINVGMQRFDSEVHLQKAYAARANSQWQTVIDEIYKAENEYYKIDPMCTPLRWYSASAYYNMGNQQKAYDDFSLSYQLNPNHVHVLNNLGTCNEIKGKHAEAIALYKRALEISPGFVDARLNLTATYYNSKRPREAYNEYRKIAADSSNQKYLQMMPLIIRPVILKLAYTIELQSLQLGILAIYNTPEWSAKTYTKSMINNITLEKQVLLEALFLLDGNEKSTNLAYIDSLKKKYKIRTVNKKDI